MAKNDRRRGPTTINGETGAAEPTPKKKRDRTRLDTPADILSELKRLYRRAKADGAAVTTLVWMAGEIRKAMETDSLAAQVEQLKLMYLRYGAPDALPATFAAQSEREQIGGD